MFMEGVRALMYKASLMPLLTQLYSEHRMDTSSLRKWLPWPEQASAQSLSLSGFLAFSSSSCSLPLLLLVSLSSYHYRLMKNRVNCSVNSHCVVFTSSNTLIIEKQMLIFGDFRGYPGQTCY